MAPKTPIDFDKIYICRTGTPYKIIENLGYISNAHDKRVKIKFLETGYEKVVPYSSAKDGNVKDDIAVLNIGKTYYSLYYGPYTILSYEGITNDYVRPEKLVKVKFHMTGSEEIVQFRYAVENDAIDKSVKEIKPTIQYTPPDIYDKLINNALEKRWRSIISRCTNSLTCSSYERYGKIGISVHPIWHDLNQFLITVRSVYGFDKFYNNPIRYHLDKDYKQFRIPKEQRIYSPMTCMFLCGLDNTNLAFIERDKDSMLYDNPTAYLMNRDPWKLFGISIINSTIDPNKKFYQAIIVIDKKSIYLGTYTDVDAAIAVYNHYYLSYMDFELIPLINNFIYREIKYEDAYKYKSHYKQ